MHDSGAKILGQYAEKLTYADARGNIAAIQRYGVIPVAYLEKHGASDLIDKLEGLKQKIKIREIKGEASSVFDFRTNSIKWNPTQGIFTNKFYILSPTTILVHEADHAYKYYTDRKEIWKNKYTLDKQYDDKEEKRVITGSETTVARRLGEIPQNDVPREDHKGFMMDVGDPASTEQPATSTAKKKKN